MTLPHKQAAELEQMLSIGDYERSPFGAILDRAYLFSERPRRQGDITARPTAELREVAKAEPNEDNLRKFGRASRNLQRVIDKDPGAAAVLAAYYGDAGAKWGRGSYGRLGALLAMTASGRKLIRKGARKTGGAKLDVTDAQRLENEVKLQKVQPLETRETLIGRAMVEAQRLFDHACGVWREVNPWSER